MFGLAMFGIIGLYIFAQITAPFFGFWLAKKCGFGKRMVVFCAVGSFLLVFVPVWHKQLPAMIVFQYLKREAGTKIYKPFEQWVEENPGVLECLEEIKVDTAIEYHRTLLYNNTEYISFASLFLDKHQKIGWYKGRIDYIDSWVREFIDILYDIEKKEILAIRKSIVIYDFKSWGTMFSSRYDGDSYIYFSEYIENFFHYNKEN